VKRVPPQLCARCKGYKRLCGLPRCPILDVFRGQVYASTRIRGTQVEGATPPGVLVGESGYPKVRVYYMVPPGVYGEDASYRDAPQLWASRREPLAQIIRLRSELVSATIRAEARDPFQLYTSEIGLATLSEAPVDSEALLAKPPVARLRFDGISKPRGPAAPAREIRVSGDPKLPRPVEKAVWDDALAEEAVWELYTSGVPVYTIQKMMSLGFLGRLRRRRLVPTRWAITAVDEILSRRLRRELRGRPSIDKPEIYYGEYLGNRFTIILLPGPGTLEWIEAWQPATVWTKTASRTIVVRVEEDPLGRATAEDGGFSAAKLPLLEHLHRRGRTADAVILREITPNYYAPVGNWHIRETVAAALARGPLAVAEDEAHARRLAGEIIAARGGDPELLLGASRLLPRRGPRRRITDFF